MIHFRGEFMIRVIRATILGCILSASYASGSNARFISPDPVDPTHPGVGTNRYAYSHNDPINKSDPSGNCTNDSLCDGSWNEATQPSDGPSTEDAVADASIYDGKTSYMIDPKELKADEILNLGTAIQSYVNSNSKAYQASSFNSAINESKSMGKPSDFTMTGLGVGVSLNDKAFTESGRIYGDFKVDIKGSVTVDPSGHYTITNGTATIDAKQQYNFQIDGKNPAVNFAIGVAASRPNMNGPNTQPVGGTRATGSMNPAYNSTFGQANITTPSNRNYSFSAQGDLLK